jgi:aminoglycoside phosphotransferase (APT) family kinase protein
MTFDRLTGVDTGAVSAWLGKLGLDAEPPLRFAPVGQGKSNLTSVVTDAAGARWVLRRPPLGKLLPSAHDVAREHRVLSALQPTPVPTPDVIGFTDDPAVTDAPLLLMSYVDGVVIDSPEIGATIEPAGRHRLGNALARTLALVHAVDLAKTGLDTLASDEPYAPRQLRRWLRQWEASKTSELPAVDELAGRLAAALPEQHEVTLVHGDLHLVNVIVAPDGSRVRAVVDWELCTSPMRAAALESSVILTSVRCACVTASPAILLAC